MLFPWRETMPNKKTRAGDNLGFYSIVDRRLAKSIPKNGCYEHSRISSSRQYSGFGSSAVDTTTERFDGSEMGNVQRTRTRIWPEQVFASYQFLLSAFLSPRQILVLERLHQRTIDPLVISYLTVPFFQELVLEPKSWSTFVDRWTNRRRHGICDTLGIQSLIRIVSGRP